MINDLGKMTSNKQKLVVITGPTASGKSSLAMKLALFFKGEIVNADSMQVYRGMDVGTAKPSIKERETVPHHLIDIADPDEEFHTALYRSLAIPVIGDIASRQRACFIVGGTGLYIKVLLGGLLGCPPSDPELRQDLVKECEKYGTIHLHERLKTLDAESAHRIHPNDRIRIIRALEIMDLTQQPLSSLIRNHGFKDNPFRSLKICLQIEREKLYHQINQRSLIMIDDGLPEETEALLKKGYSSELKPMKSIGYRHMVKLLAGDCSKDEAIRQLQRDTRRYAKRQMTWFRADPEMLWKSPEDLDGIIDEIKGYYGDVI